MMLAAISDLFVACFGEQWLHGWMEHWCRGRRVVGEPKRLDARDRPSFTNYRSLSRNSCCVVLQ
jgi:hypothetical protein